MTSLVIEKPLPRQGRERVLTRGATLLRSIGRLILTRCANGHSRGNYTYLYVSIKACWFPDSQATFGPSTPRKTYSLCDLPSLAEYLCAYSSCSASIKSLLQFCYLQSNG